MTNRFKNSSGQHLTKQLFFENDDSEKSLCIYTLKDYDHTSGGRTFPSLRKLYVEMEDPTEYLFAETYLDGWAHWVKIKNGQFFQEYYKEWVLELETRLKAKALLRIRKLAEEGGKDSLSADKILLQGGWKEKEEAKQKVGRPTKEAIKKEADLLFKSQSEFEDDFNRIIKGNIQ